ncbi:glycoside hydrolase family 47 protein [Nocardia sp. NPDC051570]|uniref:glycoside hydrolase family 47 protein n=1 Tax=Nocardia sp. NPDC051570 TaxID=3364324 RepID=UPI0037AB881E
MSVESAGRIGRGLSRRGALVALAAGVLAATAGVAEASGVEGAQIRAEFLHAWNGYGQFAWGHDELTPLSGGYSEFFVPGRPIGLSIIEALDTLYVMELDTELAAAVAWIEQHLDFDIDGDFHVFEAIIRVVGGLLAGYLATDNKKLLALTVDLADRLMPAFASPTGMPYQYVNLHTGAVSGNTPPLAEIGTNILEFGMLSQLTKDPKYLEAAKKAYRAAIAKRSPINLMATNLNVETGVWADRTDLAPNPPSDSFYEYLWGGWALLGDRDCFDWFHLLNDALTRYEVETYRGRVWYRQVDFETGAVTGRRQSELASFWPEVLGHAGQLSLGRAYYETWTAILDKYPVLPEEIDYTTMTVTSKSNQFRPEYPNASFDLYLQTHDRYYATTAWQYFLGMRTHARVPNGYTIIDDVTTSPMRLGDLFPAYGFAENFKYLYLTFTETPRFDRADFYLSTEGKILRGLRR